MTRERGSRAESKNCEILLFPTADRRFDRKVKCPTGRASFWVKFPTVRSLTRVKCPGIARGRGMGGFGIDWYITCFYGSRIFPCCFFYPQAKLNSRISIHLVCLSAKANVLMYDFFGVLSSADCSPFLDNKHKETAVDV